MPRKHEIRLVKVPGTVGIDKVFSVQGEFLRFRAEAPSHGTYGHALVVGNYDTVEEAKRARQAYIEKHSIAPKKQQDVINLREKYDEHRVEGVVMPLFKGKEPRSDSSTGFRGVRFVQGRYSGWITVKGKRHYSRTFSSAEDAYKYGRLVLEDEYLPKPQSIPSKNTSGEANISVQHKQHVDSYVVSIYADHRAHYVGTYPTLREAMLHRNYYLKRIGKLPE